MATTGSGPHVGKVLELKSPFGEESITYKWPLKKGKGSVRRSEVSFINLVDNIKYFHSNNKCQDSKTKSSKLRCNFKTYDVSLLSGSRIFKTFTI